ncbi:MAG: hypothetical protein M3Y65_18755 [Pseudomonadota bacterium]|nr:hypothetical protein [Pseudomonadota bacterium]
MKKTCAAFSLSLSLSLSLILGASTTLAHAAAPAVAPAPDPATLAAANELLAAMDFRAVSKNSFAMLRRSMPAMPRIAAIMQKAQAK